MIKFFRKIRQNLLSEGNWNENLKILWTRKDGFLGYDGITEAHETNNPCIELYFDGYFLGIKCFKRIENQNVVDKEMIELIIKYIEFAIGD
ncbi:MAG: hypothetical protein DA407_15235 [Bacteroidetes bacterium]|nr:MAG: hypothetical protein DA407_15235 [Bacteroidota bacterium]